jgi:hypothetical protein
VNGVVRTISTVRKELEAMGQTVEVIGPDRFRTLPMPSYPEIRLAIGAKRSLWTMIADLRPDCIHIATEGPLGFAARAYCLKHGKPFTTAYHTRFPEYVRDRAPIPLILSYALVRRFHKPSSAVMVATQTIEDALVGRGFANIKRWTRGVDTELFRPRDKNFLDLPPPPSIGWGPSMARSWPSITPPPTSSSSPRAPTPSGWSCWRLWRPAFPSPPIRCRDRWTWSTDRAPGFWTRI